MINSDELYFNSRTYSHINLNDFASFDHFLFGVGEKDWRTFLDVDSDYYYFIPPITNPVGIVQHQLCHYAFWMTIAKNNLKEKPRITEGAHVPSTCYACKYANLLTESAILGSAIQTMDHICNFCPLKKDSHHSRCGDEYYHYMHCTRTSQLNEASEWAEKIAKIIWKNPTKRLCSLRISQFLHGF